MYQNMSQIHTQEPDEEQLEFAEKIMETQRPKEKCPKTPLADMVLEYSEKEIILPASTDVGDVSWNCPVAQISIATWPVGTAAHSWQAVACGKSDFAHKGMLYAGQIIAATAMDICDDPQILSQAWEEFRRRTDGQPYKCPIPKDVKPEF